MTSTFSIHDLIYEAKWEGLERDEARWAEQQLLHPDLDRYKVLYLLGKGLDGTFARLVEPYLTWHEEPELARLALQILCHYWDLTSTYLSFVREFVEGVGWDEDGHIRLVAISIAGAYLRTSQDDALLARLLDLAETRDEQPGDDQVRRVARKALATGDRPGVEADPAGGGVAGPDGGGALGLGAGPCAAGGGAEGWVVNRRGGVAGATREQRTAGLAVLVLGGLNALLGLVGFLAAPAGDRLLFAVTLLAGVVLLVLGFQIRLGSRTAALVALVLLGALGVFQLVLLAVAPDLNTVLRLLITGGIGWLVLRARRS